LSQRADKTPKRRGPPRRPKPPKLRELAGRKQVALLMRHRKRLREAYCHGNRTLMMDSVLTAHLLAFFNPILRSLRTIEDFSLTEEAQAELDIEQVCRSTLSDANRVMDADLLEALIEDLRLRLPDLPRMDGKLGQLLKRLRLVDGSYFAVSADVAWALRKRKAGSDKNDDRLIRLDLQMCCVSGVPECVEINGWGTSEVAATARHIDSGVIYVADRGIFSFAWLNQMLQGQADFLLRIKTSQKTRVIRQNALTAADLAAGVLSDCIVVLEGSPGRHPPQQELREIRIADASHPGHIVRILTNLLEIEAHLAGEVYRHRWQIELFFRWLKVHAHFRHLISHSRNGVLLSFYVAVIGVLLLYLHAGHKPSKYAYNMLCLVAGGSATLEEIIPILERREREKELARLRLARQKAEKQGK
jgi:hypothetical protein